jgi:CRISPR-associated protein Cas2
MYVLITYDVASNESNGSRRLRKVAKLCTEYGQRVQYSVFECKLNPCNYEILKHKLENVIDPALDSLRFYNLGNNWKNKVDVLGKQDSYDPDGLLLI